MKDDPFLAHEALDRAHMVGEIIEDHLANHPYIRAHDDIKLKVDQALYILAEVYQLIGARSL